jgi:succinoglycan biosynthesis transport protein ExoP
VEEELSIRELIEIILKGKWIIISLTIVALLISGIVSFYLLDPIYEAKAVLSIEKINVPAITSEGFEGLVDAALSTTEVSAQSYVAEAKTADTLNKVMDKLHIDAREMPLSVLSGKISVQIIKDTDLLEVIVKDTEAQSAAAIANAVSEVMVESAILLTKEESSSDNMLLENQVKTQNSNLEKREAELIEFLQKPDSVAELEARLDTALRLLSDFQTREKILRVEKQKVKTMIETVENQLKDLPQKIELKDQDLTSEELNPVYIEVKKELELNKALLAQLNAEEASIQNEIVGTSGDINDLQVKLVEKKTNLEQLELNVEAAKENYLLFHNKKEEIRFIEMMKNQKAPLKIVSTASEPQAPVTPKKTLNLAIAGCLGLMSGVFVVLFRFFWINSNTASQNV